MDHCAACGKIFNGINDVGWVQNDPLGKSSVVRKFHSGCGDPFGIKAAQTEIEKLREARIKINEAVDSSGLFLFEHVDGSFTVQKK